jgi:iron(III) transport system substrate-binding protein
MPDNWQEIAGNRTVRKLLFAALFTTTLLTIPDSSWPKHERCHADEADARQERRVILYSSLPTADLNRLALIATKRYPYLQVDIRTGPAPALFKDLQDQIRSGRVEADIVLLPGTTVAALKEISKDSLAECPPQEARAFPPPRRDVRDLWVGYALDPRVLAYNTRFIQAKEAQFAKYEDLVNPKWKAKILLDPGDSFWYYGIRESLGMEQARKFLAEIERQDPGFARGARQLAQLVEAGERPLAMNVRGSIVEEFRAKGSAIDYVAIKPVVANLYSVAIPRGSTRPNAARIFQRFILSREGQQTIPDLFRLTPARQDVPTGLRQLEQAEIFVPSPEGFLKQQKEIMAELNKVLKQ